MPRIKPPPAPVKQEVPAADAPIKEVPLTESVTFEFEDDDPKEPAVVEVEKPKPEEEENSLAKQLEAARKAEKIASDAREAAERRAREVEQKSKQELGRIKGTVEQTQYEQVVSAIAFHQERLDAASRQFKQARASGDVDAEVEAQQIIARSIAALEPLERGKENYEQQQEYLKNNPPAPEKKEPTFEQRIEHLPQSAREWLRKHPEYITDGRKNNEIGAVHQYVTFKEGIEQWTPEYYQAIEKHLGMTGGDPEPPPRKGVTMSAPVSRESASASSGVRERPGSVTLTPEERKMAHAAFTDEKMSNAEKERLYARGKAEMQRRRANGYRDEVDERGER